MLARTAPRAWASPGTERPQSLGASARQDQDGPEPSWVPTCVARGSDVARGSLPSASDKPFRSYRRRPTCLPSRSALGPPSPHARCTRAPHRPDVGEAGGRIGTGVWASLRRGANHHVSDGRLLLPLTDLRLPHARPVRGRHEAQDERVLGGHAGAEAILMDMASHHHVH